MRDIDIRTALHKEIIPPIAAEPNSLVIDELGICQGDARIDIAVINGKLHGFEIKSEQDSLARLSAQTELYNKVFDTVTLVSSDSHIEKATKIVPEWWGLIRVSGPRKNVVLSGERETQLNNGVDPYALTQLLWREEALKALEDRGMDKGLRSRPRRHLWRALADSLPLSNLTEIVRETLKTRKSWRVA
jgi:hypothetical protein